MAYSDATVLITGGAGGIGAATARAFIEAGAHVRLVDSSIQAMDRARLLFPQSRSVTFHVSNLDGYAKCVAAIEDGPLPVAIVHLAGISLPDPDDLTDLSRFDETMQANVRNGYQLARTFFDRHRGTAENPSRLVFASSLAFRRGGFDRIAYSAAKGAIAGMVRAMSRRFAPTMHVNGVAPGIIETRMTDDIIACRGTSLLTEIPLRRFGRAEEVAHVIEFLCGPASSYVTGQLINVDGGMINS